MLTPIEHYKGKKNEHPTTLCRCDCGNERVVRTTRLRRGLVTMCAACSCAAAAKRGGETRSLPASVSRVRTIIREYRYNAKRRGLAFNLDDAEAEAIIRQACHYCGAHDGFNGIDRVENAEVYSLHTCVPCCAQCNYAKRDMGKIAFVEWARRLSIHQGWGS